MFGTYVDDICNAGNESSEHLSTVFEQRFEAKERVNENFHSAGVPIQKDENAKITVDQNSHVNRLQILLTTCFFGDFRSERHTISMGFPVKKPGMMQ